MSAQEISPSLAASEPPSPQLSSNDSGGLSAKINKKLLSVNAAKSLAVLLQTQASLAQCDVQLVGDMYRASMDQFSVLRSTAGAIITEDGKVRAHVESMSGMFQEIDALDGQLLELEDTVRSLDELSTTVYEEFKSSYGE
jgi:hypothetical protein